MRRFFCVAVCGAFGVGGGCFAQAELPRATMRVLDESDEARPDAPLSVEALASRAVVGACTPRWSDRFGGYTPMPASDMISFDPDGPGPEGERLVIAGEPWVTSRFNSGLAYWDGVDWRPMNPPNMTGKLFALSMTRAAIGSLPTMLYVGGYSGVPHQIDGVPGRMVYAFDGERAHLVGNTALSGAAYAMCALDEDGQGPGATSLFVAGVRRAYAHSDVVRWDGAMWSDVGSISLAAEECGLAIFDDDGAGPLPPSLYVAGNLYADCTTCGDEIVYLGGLARWDGSRWTDIPLPDTIDWSGYGYALRVFDADGSGAAPGILTLGIRPEGASPFDNSLMGWDGENWTRLLQPLWSSTSHVRRVPNSEGDARELFFPGSMVIGSLLWNGDIETLIPGGIYGSPDGSPYRNRFSAFSVDEDGEGPLPESLLAGGRHVQARTHPDESAIGSHFCTRYRDGRWSSFNNGVEAIFPYLGSVGYLDGFDLDPSDDAPAQLFVAGQFGTAGSTPVNLSTSECPTNRITWTGDGWGRVGNDFDGMPRAVVEYDSDGIESAEPMTVVGGWFTTIGGVPAKNIASWNGSAWQPLGSGVGLSGQLVHDLAVFDRDEDGVGAPELFAAGEFTEAGGVACANIARWDGAAWSPLGAGLNARVWTLAVFDEDGPGSGYPSLYAGGAFAAAGGSPASKIARWDGSAWNRLPQDLGPSSAFVYSMVVFDHDVDGPALPSLFVAGSFDSIGGDVALHGLARWDGQAWHAVNTFETRFQKAYIFGMTLFDEDGSGSLRETLFIGGNIPYWTPNEPDPGLFGGIAKWSNGEWAPVDGGLTASGYSISGSPSGPYVLAAHDDDGDGPRPEALFAGGIFSGARLYGTGDHVQSSSFARYGAERGFAQVRSHPVGGWFAIGAAVQLAADVVLEPGMVFRWRRDGVDLDETARISGVESAQLTIAAFDASDAGEYDLRIINECGAGFTRPAPVRAHCAGDADRSGSVGFSDVISVLANWMREYSNPIVAGPGDADLSGAVDMKDIIAVLAAWDVGCP